jgi:predicted GTPase
MRAKVIIMGAAGRDFHNFNTYFRDNANYEVVAFTATQIPNIEGRKYPAVLAGKLYPKGIEIHPESDLPELIKKHGAEQVVFAYSDVAHVDVMHKASIVNAAGADFRLMGPEQTELKSKVPVIAICAVRTGSGKSQTTRFIATYFRSKGKRVVAIRHPMPYGDLAKQAVQRFATYADLDKHECTIEEREEYEPHIDKGIIVYAGVDYEAILRQAEQEADVILWDGGNNDTPFYKSDLHIVVADPHRAEHGKLYHPGETNMRMADIVIINKCDTATPENIARVKEIAELNPKAAASGELTSRSRTECDQGQARPRHRGRPDGHPRRHEVRRGTHSRPEGGREGDRRPEEERRELHQEDFREVLAPRAGPAGDGLRQLAGQGPGGDHQQDRLRCRGLRHADRPQQGPEGQQAPDKGQVRPRGRGLAQARGLPEEVLT